MSLRTGFINWSARFNAMSLRERGLVFGALVAVLIVAWDGLLMKPLDRKKQTLNQQLESLQTNMNQLTASLTGENGGDPFTIALTKQRSLQESLAAVDAQLQTVAAGLIPPPRMVAALRDVIDRQRGLRLISLKNLPSQSLVPPVDPNQPPTAGPFVHPIEMVVEGDYLTVLKYLESVEALDWRFYWQSLELISTDYPANRVRIRLNSLSMDREWLGV